MCIRDSCDTVFRNEITENTLNLHYTLENPEILNLSDPDVSFGSMKDVYKRQASTLWGNTRLISASSIFMPPVKYLLLRLSALLLPSDAA